MSVSAKKEKSIAEDFREFINQVFAKAEQVGGDALKTRGTFAENVTKFKEPPAVVPKRKEEHVGVAVAVPKRKEEPLPPQVKKVLTDQAIICSEDLSCRMTAEAEGGKRLMYNNWVRDIE
jgi:hypothetical protein